MYSTSSFLPNALRRTVRLQLRSSDGARHFTAPARAFNYCVDTVRQHDRERFLCNLHAPTAARPGLFALHALNYETARIRSAAKDENASRGRLGWWRRAVDSALQGTPPDHPVAQALAHTHAQHGLTERYLTQLLDAREADLRVLQPRDMDALNEYCERTGGSLLLLGLECAGVRSSEAAERAAARAGTAHSIATLLRATAAHATTGCTYLPADVTRRHGVKLSGVRVLRAATCPYFVTRFARSPILRHSPSCNLDSSSLGRPHHPHAHQRNGRPADAAWHIVAGAHRRRR